MRRACDGPAWPLLASALLLACAQALPASEQLAPGICPSMDIRNNPEQINRLRGCRVIEGQLSIVLMERSTPKIYENISFPELREVTGYIMIYRTKVRNLGDLFPNLTVVRGIQLFKDFAIVIFDNEHLEALGLRSLMRIERGGVRIQHNDRLCYTNTIDWTRIIAGDADNIIRSNYDTRLCGLCPNAQSRIEDHRQSQQQCPTDSKGKLLCWDDKHCQKICPSSCGVEGCMPNGTCCHSSCLGGCDGPGATHCHVCKNYSLESSEPGSKRICVDTCPAGTYTLFRRCVTEQQCRSMPPPPQPVGTGDSSYFRYALNIRSYKILNNKSCVYMCPSGFTEEGDIHNSTCKLCPSWGCRRECVGGKIDSVATAEQFRGCTHIKGKLEISLRTSGGNTLSVLESALGEIKEIEGSLQVTRSYPLVSLMFLKKLEKIIGVSTAEHKGQVLHIINNKNLELLWDWSKGRTINITGGTLYIHSNPKLCYNQLLPLKNMTSNPRSNFTELEVSQESNGYQASCLPDVLKLRVWELRRTAVVLTWNMYCPEDMRKLLGYSIYYIAAEKNVTLYDQRDACTDTWNVLDMTIDEARNGTRDELPPPETNKTSMILNPCSNMQPSFYPVTPLVPFTRYAAYVKTYTTMQDRRGAQSSIIYFKTLPGAPSPPTSVTVELRTPYSVSIKWAPPTMPNGTIILYHVEVHANSYNKPKILAGNINYCGKPNALANMIKASLEEAPETQEEKTTGDVKNGSCACNEESKSSTRFTSRAEEERMESINFENDVQNQVYKKADRPKSKTMANRIKRSLDISLSSMLVKLTENRDPRPGFNYSNSTDEDGYVKSLYYELDGKTESLTVDSMRHFTWYTVNIWACRARADNETKEQYDDTWCSERAYYTFRTSELPNADVVNNFKAEIVKSNKTFPDVNLKWDPPANPNGFVVAYNVHYSRVEDSNQGQDVGLGTCIISDDFETAKHTHTLRALSPGNYSVRVTPITVSGAGNVSNDVYVFIPERAVESGYEWAWGLAGGGVVMLALLGGGVWYTRRGLMSPNEISKLFPSVNPEYESTVYVPDEWEVPRANIEFIRELGQGSFGMVYEGRAKNIEKGKPETRCAVKTVNEHATDRERIEFLNEASVMKAFDTFHVVRLLGVVSRGQPTLVIMELMEFGDLKTYLRSHRPDADSSLPKKDAAGDPPTLQNILQMAIEIADGMAYLSAKKFVHRDLAARNCMVAGDLTVKVGDFGMTRDIYETDYYRKGTKGLLPVRWMSPESLKDGVFSSNSDVWSYGVVLWEMATLAMQPYQGLSNEQVVRYVVEGGVMERPEHCPDRLYELMRQCWSHRAAARPSFLRLVADLAPHAHAHFRHRSFFHSPQGQEMYALQRSALGNYHLTTRYRYKLKLVKSTHMTHLTIIIPTYSLI
ncbi:insulin receptor [Manduca sexta]|uniref:insulin receptor n=1 Tax=Manduca sexta TaxID=7130 RepID=UPI00188FE37B|nr:insulin receptor [Manduca sexta]